MPADRWPGPSPCANRRLGARGIVLRLDAGGLRDRKALFGSLPAAEIQYRLSLRDAPRRQRINRLNWEVNNRAVWGEDVARRSPHAARQPLSDAEIEVRRAELQQLARTSLVWRGVTYFMGCFACQAFWTALAVYAVTRGVGDVPGWVFSTAAYAGAAVALSAAMLGGATFQRSTAPAGQLRCKTCGR